MGCPKGGHDGLAPTAVRPHVGGARLSAVLDGGVRARFHSPLAGLAGHQQGDFAGCGPGNQGVLNETAVQLHRAKLSCDPMRGAESAGLVG